jgi:hypothetical protein
MTALIPQRRSVELSADQRTVLARELGLARTCGDIDLFPPDLQVREYPERAT